MKGLCPLVLLALWCGTAWGTAGCWVEFFDEPEFAGGKFRLDGPASLATLHDVGGSDWDDRIDSLEVGPAAEVTLYLAENFQVPDTPVNHPHAMRMWKDQKINDYVPAVYSFSAGHKIHHLGEYGFHDQVSSLKIVCNGKR